MTATFCPPQSSHLAPSRCSPTLRLPVRTFRIEAFASIGGDSSILRRTTGERSGRASSRRSVTATFCCLRRIAPCSNIRPLVVGTMFPIVQFPPLATKALDESRSTLVAHRDAFRHRRRPWGIAPCRAETSVPAATAYAIPQEMGVKISPEGVTRWTEAFDQESDGSVSSSDRASSCCGDG